MRYSKAFRLFFVAIVFTLFTVNSFAQDTLSSTPGGTGSWFSKLDWGLVGALVVALYETVVRFIPTVKSISILTWIIRLLTALSPDRAVSGVTPTVTKPTLYNSSTEVHT